MLDFRKGLFALAIAGLGLAGTASAQVINLVSCAGVVNTNGLTTGIHVEGVTEQLPSVTLGPCIGTSDQGTVTFTVTSNGPITNQTNTTGLGTDAIATLTGWPLAAGQAATIVGTLGAGNLLTFSFKVTPDAPLTAPAVGVTCPMGSPLCASIAVSNVRVNATTLPAFTTYTETAAGAISGMVFATGATTSANASISQTTLGKTSFTGYNNVAICAISSSNVNAVGVVAISDAFVGGFETDIQELAKEPAIPLGSGGANIAPATQANTVGTRVALTFNNLSNNATYYLPAVVTSNNSTDSNPSNLVLNLVPGPTSICGQAVGLCSAALPGGTIGSVLNANVPAGATNVAGTITGVYGFTPTNGSFTAYYAVVSDNYGADLDSTAPYTAVPQAGPVAPAPGAAGPPVVAAVPGTEITLYEVVASPSTAVLPTGAPTVQVTVVGMVAPFYAEYTTSGAATVAAANPSGVTNTMGILNPCNTTLLFPYIITTQGYDTGIAITNASLGTSVNGNTVTPSPSTPTCTLQAWGAGSINGTPVTSFSLGSFAVAAGQVYAANLSMLLPSTQPTFAGYAVATCNFQGGQGFAQISNQASGFSEGYLAPILGDIFEGAFMPIQDQN